MSVHQIKMFKGLECDLPAFEVQVNKWLAESKVKVVNIFGNLAPQTVSFDQSATSLSKSSFLPSDVWLVIIYEVV